VVTSTALHASILHDSETLRKEIPGLARFKVAAEKNIDRWYNSDVALLPSESGKVLRYDNMRGIFVDMVEENASLEMSGPFAYFLSTVNVDRLEPSFMVTPLHSKLSTQSASMDLVIVRPTRDKTVTGSSDIDRKRFAEKTGTVMRAAYQGGSHVQLKYAGDGSLSSEGEGIGVVEYIRCGGWQWNPKRSDDSAHLLCADGTIFQIEKGGKATCKVMSDNESIHLSVYV